MRPAVCHTRRRSPCSSIQIAEVNQQAVCAIDGLYMASNESCFLRGPTAQVSAMSWVNGDYISSVPFMQYQEGTPIFSFTAGISGGSGVLVTSPGLPLMPPFYTFPVSAESYAWSRFHFFSEGPARTGSYQFNSGFANNGPGLRNVSILRLNQPGRCAHLRWEPHSP